MRFFVPFDARNPKTRLAELFDDGERREFARALLADVLAAVRGAGHDLTVLATAPVDVDAPVTVDDRPLTPAVEDALAGTDLPAGLVAADCPLATPAAIQRLVAVDAGVTLAPGLGGGTNALVVRTADFHVDFHGVSIRDHRERAREAGVEPATLDSFRLALDVDEPADLVEVLLHGSGEAAAWLREAGVDVAATDGRVEPTRRGDSGAEPG